MMETQNCTHAEDSVRAFYVDGCTDGIEWWANEYHRESLRIHIWELVNAVD